MYQAPFKEKFDYFFSKPDHETVRHLSERRVEFDVTQPQPYKKNLISSLQTEFKNGYEELNKVLPNFEDQALLLNHEVGKMEPQVQKVFLRVQKQEKKQHRINLNKTGFIDPKLSSRDEILK